MTELLEARIAPASVVTYFDIDGDLVKITASKGPLDAADLKFVGGGANGQLAELAIFNPEFSGANITFSVTRKPGGDGLAHVGLINGAFVDLGKVVVKGDLGEIQAGDTDPATTGLASLQVRSMGTFGSFTQGTSSSLDSTVVGKMGPLRVTRDFAEVLFVVTGGANGSAGPISIGGDLRGSFVTSGSMGAVTVGGDLIADPAGTFGQTSLTAGGDMGAIRIGGMILGGPTSLSGLITSHGNLVSLSVHGSVIAASGSSSGGIQVDGNIGSVAIGGSLIGLSFGSGSIECLGNIGSVRIGGDLMGADTQCRKHFRQSYRLDYCRRRLGWRLAF